jgi:hypothetical protein
MWKGKSGTGKENKKEQHMGEYDQNILYACV